ncbi:ATP-binding protein [Shinella zoogloeoides]|uniref:ATP-binding protein n=1 Tax=Shinella zoogloeoides TaxID=352475 RepID=UPI0028B08299|nr:ATP-binding protein [Shinella zoogloeoides]
MVEETNGVIADLISVPGRFLRSVQLEKDFRDRAALEGYIVTPPMVEALLRIIESVNPGSKRRAWRVTGDYGVGKSSMALVLARLLSGTPGKDADRIAAAIGWSAHEGTKKLLPVLVTGAREGIAAAVARGVRDALDFHNDASISGPGLDAALQECEAAGSVRALEHMVSQLTKEAAKRDRGVLLIIDEMGKLLEHAALNPDREDVFALQRLGEFATRSGDHPLLLVGILHQGFQAYAERLPLAQRHEWDKVAGRFEEVVFDQPLVHTAALAAGALGINTSALSDTIVAQAHSAIDGTARIGWLGGRGFSVDPTSFYPLHPALLPVMVRFFSQFGQSERSLFGFLLSTEPMALQAFAAVTPVGSDTFDLSRFYDYVRASFGHRLASANHQSQWQRITATIDACVGVDPLALRILKTVGLLNLLDADDLLPTSQSISASLSAFGAKAVDAAIDGLTQTGLLFNRGGTGAFRLWPNSSINLHSYVELAKRAVGPIEEVAPALGSFLDREMILARRHYLETGTMRYFELRYAFAGDLAKVAAAPTDADGVVVLSLADRKEQQVAAKAAASDQGIADNPALLIGMLGPVWHLASYLRDVMIWRWVEANTPDLASDDFAATEVRRQVRQAHQALKREFDALSDPNSGSGIDWIYRGEAFDAAGNLPRIVSHLCSDLYPLAPRIANELINRNALSSAAAAARMRLIEGIFRAPDKRLLGMDERKAPPEKSMYLSVLQRGALHVADGDSFTLQIPPEDKDPLYLRPSLVEVLKLIHQAKGCRVAIKDILAVLAGRPFGVRHGLAPILLAIVVRVHAHELALYENGTFLAKFGDMEFLRLIKAPQSFEIQHCSVEGVRSNIFIRLADLFARGIEGRKPALLDVVTELCLFAAKLPEFTRKTKSLSPVTLAVRDALLSAREPATLLFADLPHACGLPVFRGEDVEETMVETFIERFTDAVSELQNSYGELIKRIVQRTAVAIGQKPEEFDRVALASRGARVSLAAREPRLRAFSLRLRDPALHDEAWAESLASFVVSKPPGRWLPGDEVRFIEEMGALAEVFAKVESTVFSTSDDRPDVDAIRLNLTRGDGRDLLRVLHPVTLDEDDQDLMRTLAKRLPQGETQRVQILTNLLWLELEKSKESEPADELAHDAASTRTQHDH